MPTEHPRPHPASAFAAAVRDARQRAGLSAGEVAERIGVEPADYAAIERGEGNVDLELVVQIASALDLSAAELSDLAGL